MPGQGADQAAPLVQFLCRRDDQVHARGVVLLDRHPADDEEFALIGKVVELSFGSRPCGRAGDPEAVEIDLDALTDLADHGLVRRILLAPGVALSPEKSSLLDVLSDRLGCDAAGRRKELFDRRCHQRGAISSG